MLILIPWQPLSIILDAYLRRSCTPLQEINVKHLRDGKPACDWWILKSRIDTWELCGEERHWTSLVSSRKSSNTRRTSNPEFRSTSTPPDLFVESSYLLFRSCGSTFPHEPCSDYWMEAFHVDCRYGQHSPWMMVSHADEIWGAQKKQGCQY
jgi:hypothetical protein